MINIVIVASIGIQLFLLCFFVYFSFLFFFFLSWVGEGAVVRGWWGGGGGVRKNKILSL